MNHVKAGARLSEPQVEILEMIYKGMRLVEIAAVRGVAVSTIRNQVGDIRGKLSARTTEQAVYHAVLDGYLGEH